MKANQYCRYVRATPDGADILPGDPDDDGVQRLQT